MFLPWRKFSGRMEHQMFRHCSTKCVSDRCLTRFRSQNGPFAGLFGTPRTAKPGADVLKNGTGPHRPSTCKRLIWSALVFGEQLF